MAHETAGDPISGLKWTRRTTERIATELRALGIEICARSVARLLKQMDFSLRVNHQQRCCGTPHPNRDAQFERIAALRQRCATQGSPIISIDTKKKELVGAFKNPGAKWDREPVRVNDHDCRSDAEARAVPYGIYDVQANLGTVFVSTSHDTPGFAVDCVETWWRTEGCQRDAEARHLTILADGGGSNGCVCRAWKYGLQHQLCNRHGLTVTVAHYPTGASKWNPIEHRLFSEISKHWAGQPLDSLETILNYIRTTTTATGLRVRAEQLCKVYPKGIKITDAQMKQLKVTKDKDLPRWTLLLRWSWFVGQSKGKLKVYSGWFLALDERTLPMARDDVKGIVGSSVGALVKCRSVMTGSTLPVIINHFATAVAVSPEGPERSGGAA